MKESGGLSQPEITNLAPALLAPSPTNPRKIFGTKEDDELVESLNEHGMLQPIIARPHPDKKKAKTPYMIVVGERRWRAAGKAGLEMVPVIVAEMNDAEVLEAQITENLQRADVHPLEQCDSYHRLMTEAKVPSVAELARRLGKPETHVARMMKLVDLSEPSRKAYANGEIQLGHALLLATLTPQDQKEAFATLGDEYGFYDHKANKYVKNFAPVKELEMWIRDDVMLDLAKAPFKLDDAELFPKAGACVTCPKRTGANGALFPDVKNPDTCTDRDCFDEKEKRYLLTRVKEAKALNAGKDVLKVSTSQYWHDKPKDVRLAGNYFVVAKKTPCEYAQKALVVHGGNQDGEVIDVCISPSCKDHAARPGGASPSVHRSSPSQGSSVQSAHARGLRKQELFDARTAEAIRADALKAAILDVTWKKLTIEDWRRIANEMWNRIPSDTQAFMNRVLRKPVFEKASLEELAQFMSLCSVGHYGENFGLHFRKPQGKLIEFVTEHKVNYDLLDAEQRVKTVGKKYLKDHEAYRDKVKAGKTPSAKPSVVAKPTPVKKAVKKTASMKASKKTSRPKKVRTAKK